VRRAKVSRMNEAAVQQVQVDSGSDLGLIVRAAEICNPFLDALGEVTLEVRGPVASSVLNWNSVIYGPVIVPAMRDVHRKYALGGNLEIAGLDCVLDSRLPRSVALQSRTAGKRLVGDLLPPRGDRVIERYRIAVLAGDSPGHLAVIHALRAALFSLPPGVTEGAYLFQEGMGAGLDGRDITRFLIGGILGHSTPSPLTLGSLQGVT
jgi:hypothetical protein